MTMMHAQCLVNIFCLCSPKRMSSLPEATQQFADDEKLCGINIAEEEVVREINKDKKTE